jgi:hypothetical protein
MYKRVYAPIDRVVDFVSAFELMRRGWTRREVDIVFRISSLFLCVFFGWIEDEVLS